MRNRRKKWWIHNGRRNENEKRDYSNLQIQQNAGQIEIKTSNGIDRN